MNNIDEMLWFITMQLKALSVTETKKVYNFHLSNERIVSISKKDIQKRFLTEYKLTGKIQ